MRRIHSVILLGVLVVASCAKAKDDEGKTASGARVVTGARTVVVSEQPFVETIDATAVVSGRPGHLAVLSAPGASRIASVHAVVGQHVRAGDALVELDQVAFRGAVQSADAALSAAEKNAARLQRLTEAGIAPRRDLELATAELAAARATAETARRQADLSILRSPISGIVTQVMATLGASVEPSQVLAQVADGSALDLVISLTPEVASRVRTGIRIELFGGGRGKTSAIGEASVSAVGGAVDSATRSVIVRAEVRSAGRTLQIGETLDARIEIGTHARALLVPLEALVPDGESYRLFVVDADGMAHARSVVVGGRSDGRAEITSGLKAGERVVTYGAYGMDDSVKVAPATPAGRAPDAK